VTAVIKVQTHKAVTGLQYGQQHSGIGLRARVGLYVGVLSTKQLAYTVNSQLLNLIDNLATAIVTVAGIAFCIFVGKVAAHGFHDLVANEVLTGDELDAFQLTLVLLLNQLKNLIVSFHCYYTVFDWDVLNMLQK
jgi:hypothetical protein